MRALIVDETNNALHNMAVGWANAIQTKGQAIVGNGRFFDIFYEMNPTHVICSTKNLTVDLVKCINQYKPQVYLRLGNWAQFDAPENITQEEVNLAQYIKPTKVFTHYLPEYQNLMVGGWLQLFSKPESILPAWDSIRHKRSEPFNINCGYVGGYTKNKQKSLDKLVRLWYNVPDVKIWGYGNWPCPIMGKCIPETENKVLSGPVVNILDDFSVELGADINERPFKVLGCGGWMLAQYNDTTHAIFGNNIEYFQTYEELEEKIKNKKKPQHFNMDDHTYIKRMEQLLV